MAKASKPKKVTLVGGKNAHLVNPLELTKQFKSVCIPEGKVISEAWRDTKAEARADAREHILQGHFIDYQTRIKV
jgi:hypothetical protein